MITFKSFVLKEDTEGSTGKIVNGEMPESLMMQVDSIGNKLVKSAAIDFLRAVSDSTNNTGTTLRLVGPNSSYRTLQQQEEMARRYGIGQAARPGTSNHGFGIAVDVVKDNAWKWFVSNSQRYGYYQLNSTNEAHHFDYKKNVPEFQGKQLVNNDGSPAVSSEFETKTEEPYGEEDVAQPTPTEPTSLLGQALGQVQSGFNSLMPKLY